MSRQVIRHERTSRTADLILRPEHEVIGDELLATFEEVEELDRPIGTDESIVLVELDHWEVAEFGIEGVVGAQSGFFLGEKLLAGCEPFDRCYDLHSNRNLSRRRGEGTEGLMI